MVVNSGTAPLLCPSTPTSPPSQADTPPAGIRPYTNLAQHDVIGANTSQTHRRRQTTLGRAHQNPQVFINVDIS
ncbi:hypothetical protein Pcinc_027355 [Petrolisthes cinctipes]|uniref:Uncharacterized protein n=1 Tax=Petrolisthes cinctipes TaxID=88211 RepID=A0AAE1KAD7_PETCI|nr:hypothetical protein Pcinc_027355 [Petrolisthes cinctipes]